MIQSEKSQRYGISTSLEKPFRLYASDLPDLVYCERLFYMKKVMDIPRVETYPMVRGTNEHEIRRILAKHMLTEYEACKTIESLEKLDFESVIDSALDYGRELARVTRTVFYLRLEEARSDLKYRLELEEKQRLETAVKMAKKFIKETLKSKFHVSIGDKTFSEVDNHILRNIERTLKYSIRKPLPAVENPLMVFSMEIFGKVLSKNSEKIAKSGMNLDLKWPRNYKLGFQDGIIYDNAYQELIVKKLLSRFFKGMELHNAFEKYQELDDKFRRTGKI